MMLLDIEDELIEVIMAENSSPCLIWGLDDDCGFSHRAVNCFLFFFESTVPDF